MRIVAHLSDLHFGRVDVGVLEPLRRAVVELGPHVVVVSGDLTQRARARQFREARAFLDSLPKPQIVVPGNHDVPLYNIFRRFYRPLHNYQRYISQDLEPAFIDDEIAIVGLNTARSLTIKGGRVNEEQIEQVRARLCDLPERMIKAVVTHHPFDVPLECDADHIVGRASIAMRMLSACGADVLLAGHLHTSHAGEPTERHNVDGYSGLVVQAGTATSTRERGEANSFNALRIGGREIMVERHAWDTQALTFRAVRSEVFVRSPSGWMRKAAAPSTETSFAALTRSAV
jgi:3',5'-cyclic AMP phosphodiesterase CpdA